MNDDEREKKNPDTSFERQEEKLDIYRYKPESGTEYTKHGIPERIQTYWRKLMDSTQKRMSQGAEKIVRMFSWAHGDNWRRGGEGNREHKKAKKG